ncbi:hypothetical protein C8R46DRAFT_1343843 [Mycena filopes]|nr:hypothetical protein C8R46DRAFT_1343843 [Mycena filopes]
MPPIHPSLRLDLLAGLSPVYRRTAQTAARASHESLACLNRLNALIERMPDSQVILLLPVYYANLDPADIPTTAELDASAALPGFERAYIALQGLQIVTCIQNYPADVSPKLWPRVWAWIEFFHEYRDNLPDPGPFGAEAYITWGLLLMGLREHRETAALISKHPGVNAFATRAWMLTLDVPENALAEYCAKAEFMLLLNPSEAKNFKAMVAEAGGYDQLAALVVRHITLAFPRDSAKGVTFYGAVVTILNEADDKFGPFNAALLANGAVAALVKAIPLLTAINHSIIPSIRSTFFTLVGRRLITPPGYVGICEAIDAGLLRALVQCMALGLKGPANVDTQLLELIQLISPAMVYYATMTRIERRLPDADRVSANQDFVNSPVLPAWTNLRSLCEERLLVLKRFKARESPSRKACDNLNCDTGIGLKADYRKCSSCAGVYYCSGACQVIDWKEGGHRTVCRNLRSTRLSEFPLSGRERSFFRAVMQHDLNKQRKKLAAQRVHFIRTFPDMDYYVVFDYTQPQRDASAVQIKIHRVPGPTGKRDTAALDWEALWADAVARVGRSGGKMESQLMVVKEGVATRMRLFPQRTHSKRVHDAGLKLSQLEFALHVAAVEMGQDDPLDLVQIY